MSGLNDKALDIPPGIVRENTKFATDKRWFDGNLVRWFKDVLVPVGGWATYQTLTGPTQPVRTMFSWYDNSLQPWIANGSADKVILIKPAVSPTQNDITPATLSWSPGTHIGYGGGAYGSGPYGKDSPTSVTIDQDAMWSFDNFGEDLVAVHTQDGRLFNWSPLTPTNDLADVLTAPADNRLVVVTDERHVMLLGGVNHPRRVKWCSKEDISQWTATETNSAGGFELDSEGRILAVAKTVYGIMVWTNNDVHLIEWVGGADVYTKRVLTRITGIKSQNGWAVTPNGVIWLGGASFWRYDGAVSQLPCDVQGEIFSNSNLGRGPAVFLCNNEQNQEVWAFYPALAGSEATRYVMYSYKSRPFWSLGRLSRTAMLNPVYQSRPYMAYNQTIYEHELGWLADGASRSADVYAISGYVTLDKANKNIRCDRIWPDAVNSEDFAEMDSSVTFPYNVTFRLKQAPMAAARTKGPITLNNVKGYTTTRFRARMAAITVQQTVDTFWGAGHLMLRTKVVGGR